MILCLGWFCYLGFWLVRVAELLRGKVLGFGYFGEFVLAELVYDLLDLAF